MSTSKSPQPKPARRAAYHHGNLRASLVEHALRAIDAHGVEGFSLREAAAQAGVSSSAAYRHFSDKAQLLAEIARSGFASLAAAVEEAMAAARAAAHGPAAQALAAFEAQGLAYVRFAVAHPTRYRVMFGPYGAGSGLDVSGRSAAGRTPYELLLDVLDALQANGLLHPSRRQQAPRTIWAATHGLADLVISKSIDLPPDEGVDAATLGVVRAVLSGLSSDAAPGPLRQPASAAQRRRRR